MERPIEDPMRREQAYREAAYQDGRRDERDSEVHRERRYERRRGGFGRTLFAIICLVIAVVAILFATDFWKADVRTGALPDVNISVKGGELPKIGVESKKVVVGTKQETVDVPVVEVKDGAQ